MTGLNTRVVPVSAAEGYRLWSPTYDTDPNPLLSLEFRTVAARLRRTPADVVLDVGCGTGRWTAYAAESGARAVGIDASYEMLCAAGRKSRIGGSIAQAEALWLPFADESVDAVVCSFALSYVAPLEGLIAELARVVKHGGTVLVSDMHPDARMRGWRRTFRRGESVFEIESHTYPCDQILDAGRGAGLVLKALLEPRFGEPEWATMRAAGMASRIGEAAAVPAILVVEWERP